MKRILTLVFVLGAIFQANAQNIQVHYDFGENRQMVTSTIEMFKPDKLGNTFFFFDFEYGSKGSGVEGVSVGYLEFARVLKTEKMPVGFHMEYNGGLGRFISAGTQNGFRINDAFLTGVDYSWNAKDFSKGFTIKALYKHIVDKHDASFQVTGVWYVHLLKKKLTFTGFADFWREDSDFNFDGEADAKYTFLTEPQLWYNFTSNFSAGGEVEISNNFVGNEGFMINPTLAVKYNF